MKNQIKQQNEVIDDRLPDYLESYDSLTQHFRGQLEDLSTTEKGKKFEQFVQRLIPRTEVGSDFNLPDLHGKSGDEGVDLITQGKEGRSVLYIQARIVIRAEEVKGGEAENKLILSKGSVVNGCQTTMCLVEYAKEPCYVPVKVVQTEDSWDIAKAANYQNSVYDIDIELARVLRPQLVKRAAIISGGFQIDDGEKSALAFKIWMQEVMPTDANDAEIRQQMRARSMNSNFTGMYRKLCMEADLFR